MTGWHRFLETSLFRVGDSDVTAGRLLVSLLLLALTPVAARMLRVLLDRRVADRLETGVRYSLSRLAQYVVWVGGLLLAVQTLRVDLTGVALVAGALSVGVGFGLQNLVSNFVSGVVLLFERHVKVGDRITVEGIEGNVREVSFRATTIVTNDNIEMIIPNADLISGKVINWSHAETKVRIHVPVGVAYGSDVALVTRLLLEVARGDAAVLAEPEPMVFFTAFGDSALLFELLVWTEDPRGHFRLRSRLNFAIDAAFRQYGVTIPFPQRDVHVTSVPAGSGGPGPLTT